MTPLRRPRRSLTSGGPGRAVMRHLLPAAVGALIVLGFLRWLGEDRGLYGSVAGVLLMTVVCISAVGGLLWYFALWVDRDEIARQDVEAELRRSSRYFELSRDLVCTAGFDGYFKQLNAAWTETLGWSEDELRARPFVEFVHDEDRARTEEQTADLAVGGVTVDFVNRYATKDGGWRWIESTRSSRRGARSATRSSSSAATASGTATCTPTTSAPRSRPASTPAGRARSASPTCSSRSEEERWVREAEVVADADASPRSTRGHDRGRRGRASATASAACSRSLGVQQVVAGGQSMNPSTAQILEAVEACAGRRA